MNEKEEISFSRGIKLNATISDLKRHSTPLTEDNIREALERHGLCYDKLSLNELTYFNKQLITAP